MEEGSIALPVFVNTFFMLCPAPAPPRVAPHHSIVHGTNSGKRSGTGAAHVRGDFGGVVAQRGHSANYYIVYPGNTPEIHPPTGACMIHSKQHGVQNSGPMDPWQASDLKKKTLV